jgi:hypothetical protein
LSWTETLHRLTGALTAHKPSLYPAEEWDDLNDLKIGKLSVDGFQGEQRTYALAVKAGLHLFNESLDASHELSQGIHHSTGSYWHGIMHRMEGDYSNAKYWFRMVSTHPVYNALAKDASQYLKECSLSDIASAPLWEKLEKLGGASAWDPYTFVDLVEQQVTVAREAKAEELLQHIQWLEMRRLLQYSYAQSGGGGQLIELPEH